MADNSKGMTDEQVAAISEEGDRLVAQLPACVVEKIFKQ